MVLLIISIRMVKILERTVKYCWWKGKQSKFWQQTSQGLWQTFPSSKRESNYMFMWFCLFHGHVYGFHMIPGNEGRKDVSASMYCYLQKPPKVFYDFTCSLSEYTQNRKSGYFSKTFFHNIFDGYSHKCLPTFRYQGLARCSGVNQFVNRLMLFYSA